MWAKYEKALKKIEYDIDANLDISIVLRRLRMHGFVLDFLLSKNLIKGFIELTENKPIRYITMVKPENRWDQLEALSKYEKLRFHFFKKAMHLRKSETNIQKAVRKKIENVLIDNEIGLVDEISMTDMSHVEHQLVPMTDTSQQRPDLSSKESAFMTDQPVSQDKEPNNGNQIHNEKTFENEAVFQFQYRKKGVDMDFHQQFI